MPRFSDRKHYPCPRCLNEADKASWKPPPGYDPLTCQFKCSHCDYEFYVTPKSLTVVSDQPLMFEID